jgi:hypothetical protein
VRGFDELADVCPGAGGSIRRLRSAGCCALRTVFVLYAMTTALPAETFAQELPGLRIEQTYMKAVPLHPHHEADLAGRRPGMEAAQDRQ